MEKPICSTCGKNPRRINFNKLKDGTRSPYFEKYCRSCSKKVYRQPPRGGATLSDLYRLDMEEELNKLKCAECKFTTEDPCQLDVHHIDDDHKNNSRENLMVICANCHRLKHFGKKQT